MTTFTRTYRRTAYAAIDPTNPANTQAGRNVLITGSTSGIGFATARAFLLAGARTVILTGRNESRLSSAVSQLQTHANGSSKGSVLGLRCDAAVPSDIAQLWRSLATTHRTVIDTLILNVAALSSTDDKDRPLTEEIWRKFQVNVLGTLKMVEGFQAQSQQQQEPREPLSSGEDVNGKDRVIIHLSTARAHSNPQPVHDGYGPSKVAMSKAIEAIDDEAARDPGSNLRAFNVNPGIIKTEAALKFFPAAEDWMFDDVELPASFIVWLTTQPAAFLHGRFLWANWDVDDLLAMRERFEREPGLLRIGLNGLENVESRALMAELKKMDKAGQ